MEGWGWREGGRREFTASRNASFSSGPGAVLLPRAESRELLLPASRGTHLQQAHRLYPVGVPKAGLPGGGVPEHLQFQTVEDLGTLGPLCCELYCHDITITSSLSCSSSYQEHMFQFEVEKETYALKPMNCPGHW